MSYEELKTLKEIKQLAHELNNEKLIALVERLEREREGESYASRII